VTRDTTQPGAEATEVSPYTAFLFTLLSTAMLFGGFDAGMLGFAAPDTRATLDIGLAEWGLLNSFIRLGVMISFFLLLHADRWGRRIMMIVTVVGYATFTGLTAFVTDKWSFTLCQFGARLFLTAEFSLAVIVIGEECPARLRGRAIAILTSLATVGVMLIAKTQAYVLLETGARGNWLHDLGASIVASGQAYLGQHVDGADWRALYALGLLPLIVVLLLRLGMRETRRFEASRAERPGSKLGVSFREMLEAASIPWRREYLKRTALVALMWNSVYLVTGPSVVYWVIFAREHIGLSPAQVGDIIFWGYASGVAGHFAAGWLIDRIGRKYTCAAFYAMAAISIFFLYQIPTLAGQYVWMISTVFAFGAANTGTHVYASELFPTEIRATGYGWTTNVVGRVTEVVTPMAIGLLIVPLGISWSIAVVAVGPIIGSVLVLRFAPETKGLTLEEVQEQLMSERHQVEAPQ
jgi:putative MFS transporter